MQRFIYNASALALGGVVTRPANIQLQPQSACVLPSTGGRISASGGPVEIRAGGEFILSAASTESSIEGLQEGGDFVTTTRSVIRDLNVLNILRAAEVVVRQSCRWLPNGSVQVDISGSSFSGLTIDGRAFDIGLDHDMAADAADYKRFRQHHPERPESHGKVVYSLARHPDLKFDAEDFGYIQQPGFGRIYFGDWTVAPYRQTLAMVRLQLGSPAEGRIVIGGSDSDGTMFP